MSSLLTRPLVQHHLSRVSPIQLRDFPLDALLFDVFFAAILLIALLNREIQRVRGLQVLADLAHLQEQQSKGDPETALERARCTIWRMMYVDDACIVSRSPRRLERTMAICVEVFGAFGSTISESKMETMCMPIPCAPAKQIIFNVTSKQHRRATPFAYLGGNVAEAPNLVGQDSSADPCGCMSFRRFTRELYDHPKASLPYLKARIMKSDAVVVEKLSCTDAPLGPLLRATTTSSVLKITGCCFEA